MANFIDWQLFINAFEELIGEVKDESCGETCVSIGMYDTWGYGDESWDFDYELMEMGREGWSCIPEFNDPNA